MNVAVVRELVAPVCNLGMLGVAGIVVVGVFIVEVIVGVVVVTAEAVVGGGFTVLIALFMINFRRGWRTLRF